MILNLFASTLLAYETLYNAKKANSGATTSKPGVLTFNDLTKLYGVTYALLYPVAPPPFFNLTKLSHAKLLKAWSKNI